MKKVILVISLAGLTLVLTTLAEAADIQAVLDDAAGASAFVVQDSASTTMASIDSDGNVVIKGGVRLDSAGTEYTTAEDLIVDGNIGVNDITPDAKLDVDNTSATVDSFGVTHSASAGGINAVEIGFTQQDDADATDTNAAISISATSSSLDADTLLGIDIGNITAGTANEYAIRIGTGWDSNIVITEDGTSKTKIDLASGAGNAKWIAVDSGWALSFVNDGGFKFYHSGGAGKAFGTNVMNIDSDSVDFYVDSIVGTAVTNRWLKMYGNILFEESDDFIGTWAAGTITLGNIQGTATATTFSFGRASGIDIFNLNVTGATYNFKTLSSSGTDDITLDPAGGDVIVDGSTLTLGNGATTAGLLQINEDTDNGTNNATFTVPALAADTDYILPTTDGDANQFLQTNGTGTLTWADPGAGAAFPVGSVFISVVSTNPATLLGYGTWSAIGAGRVLVGLDSGDTDFDVVEETGGAKTVVSTGTVSQPTFTGDSSTVIVNHTHQLSTILRTATTGSQSTIVTRTVDATSTGDTTAATDNPTGGSASYTPTGTVSQPTFTGNATSVVQPYIVVYMWKRTA